MHIGSVGGLARCCTLLLAGVLAHGVHAQAPVQEVQHAPVTQTGVPPAAPVPARPAVPTHGTVTHGTVLFERHTTPADDAVPPQEASPPEKSPENQPSAVAPVAETSPNRRRPTRRGLQHRMPEGETSDASATANMAGEKTPATRGAAAASPTPPCAAACDTAVDDIADSDRNALQVLQTALDLHLNLQTGETAVHAKLLLRNTSAVPLPRLVLQISSSLQWQTVRMSAENSADAGVALHQHTIVTDADHTGSATELVVVLPRPLAPGATANLDLFYGGVLGTSTQRLLRLGAPPDRAALVDWDTVSDRFTGLRGFGNVLWMPVAAPVALLGANSSFAGIVDAQRLRNRQSRMSLRLTVETSGPAPGAAFFLGSRQPLMPVSSALPADAAPAAVSSSTVTANEDASGEVRLYTAQWPMTSVGAELPSLFLSAAPEQAASLRVATDNAAAADAYGAAADRLRPLLEEWLSPLPARALDVLDLPLSGAQPFAADDLLVAPLQTDEAKVLAPVLAYPLASAWLPAHSAPWLAEGLPEFVRLLALERNGNRGVALASLAAGLPELLQRNTAQPATALPSAPAAFSTSVATVPVPASLPDPLSPEVSSPPLAVCVDAACARIKGAYVLTMLRGLTGDAPLKQAVAGWVSTRAGGAGSAETDTATFERLLQEASGKDLRWFFVDWIDRDAGLPDLAIVNVAPRRIERGTVTNTVPTERRPVSGPIGAEPVVQPGGPAEQESSTEASRNRIAPREGSWLIAVEVQNNGDAVAEIPVTVRGSGLQNTLPLRIPAHSRATVRVPFEAAPEEVTVNDGTTPERRSMTHRRTITLPENLR